MLNAQNSIVLVIDIQEKLTAMLKEDVKEEIEKKSQKLIKAAKILNIETILTEQYPKGLGETILGIKEILKENYNPIEKTSFSALKEEKLANYLKSQDKKHVILCGIETHICVYQTALELLEAGFCVHIPKDICASRNKFEYKCALENLKQEGAKITCLEMILFQWLTSSKHPNFKEIQTLIK